jgi:hypothetical protein
MERRLSTWTVVRLVALTLALAAQTALARGPLTLFEQPVLKDATENIYVVAKPKKGNFFLVLWQRNPHRQDGALIPVNWPVGDKTGFYPGEPALHQRGMRDTYGSTAVQVSGDTIGAYLNSADLIHGSANDLEMITPAYEFADGARVAPFVDRDDALTCSLQLQVPVARDGGKPGSSAYVNLNLLFGKDGGAVRVSFNGGLFFNGREKSPETIGYDAVTRNVLVVSPIRPDSKWSTYASGSAVRQGAPWKGWKTFHFTVTRDNFESALNEVKKKHPEMVWGSDPATWTLNQIHLNAEIRYRTAPAELGWSMRGLKCGVAPASGVSKDVPASAPRQLNRVLRELFEAIPQ